jgi:hypothetical protein
MGQGAANMGAAEDDQPEGLVNYVALLREALA